MKHNTIGTLFQIIGKVLLSFVFVLVISIPLSILWLIGLTAFVVWTEGWSTPEMLIHIVSTHPNLETGLMYVQFIAFLAVVPIMYGLFEKKKGWSLGWRDSEALVKVRDGSLLGAVMISIVFFLIWGLQGIDIKGGELDSDILLSQLSSFILFAFVAVNEELFSRGYLQGLIHYHFGTISAVLGSTLVFTLLHSLNPGALHHPVPLLNIFLVGILLSVSRIVTGSLWVPIGIHLTWNFFQGSVYGFAVSGLEVESVLTIEAVGPSFISGGNFGAEGSIVSSLVTLAALYWIWRRYTAAAKARRYA